MARQHSLRWIAGQLVRANNRKPGRRCRFRRPPGATSRPKRRSRTLSVAVLLAMAGIYAGQGTERHEPPKVGDILVVVRP